MVLRKIDPHAQYIVNEIICCIPVFKIPPYFSKYLEKICIIANLEVLPAKAEKAGVIPTLMVRSKVFFLIPEYTCPENILLKFSEDMLSVASASTGASPTGAGSTTPACSGQIVSASRTRPDELAATARAIRTEES